MSFRNKRLASPAVKYVRGEITSCCKSPCVSVSDQTLNTVTTQGFILLNGWMRYKDDGNV